MYLSKDQENWFWFYKYKQKWLSNVLRKFYVKVRKQGGSYYYKTSLVTLRFGMQQQIKELHTANEVL